jgi:hypothetical protein
MFFDHVFAGKTVVGKCAVIYSQRDSHRSSRDVALTIEEHESIGEPGRDGARRLTIARVGEQGGARSLKDEAPPSTSCAKTQCCENKSNPIAASVINAFFVTIPSQRSKMVSPGSLHACVRGSAYESLAEVYLKRAAR